MTYIDCLHSKYDNFFKAAIADGWANDSSGNVEAPSNWFAKMSQTPKEALELVLAFPDEFTEIDGNLGDKIQQLIGYFGCEINTQGFIWVYRFASQAELDEWYQAKEDEYSVWNG